jgi:hypothetical protein
MLTFADKYITYSLKNLQRMIIILIKGIKMSLEQYKNIYLFFKIIFHVSIICIVLKQYVFFIVTL